MPTKRVNAIHTQAMTTFLVITETVQCAALEPIPAPTSKARDQTSWKSGSATREFTFRHSSPLDVLCHVDIAMIEVFHRRHSGPDRLQEPRA
jgi:hypothetical protein